MTFNTILTGFLPRQLNFPTEEPEQLARVLNKSYIDISNRMNERSIGVYAIDNSIVNGNSWYLRGQTNKLQGMHQAYSFSSIANIPHGLNLSQIQIVEAYGSFTDGTNSYGAIYASNVAIIGQVSFYITPTNIVLLSGAGAPTPSDGTIVLQWIVTT